MKKIALLSVIIAGIGLLTGCSILKQTKEPLDPKKPITVTVWHYYNGHIKDKFDNLVAQFNETVGMEKGIVIDAKSQGDVQQLASAVIDAANKTIGSQPLPDIFAAYPDSAVRVHETAELVNLETYFTKEELSVFRQDFLKEGQFGGNEELYIIPIAKSTEVLYLNKTYWNEFVKETQANIKDLETWEGLVETAKLYYEHTDKAFFGIDANANYMLLAAIQLGEEMYSYGEGDIKLNFRREVAWKIWENYYIPYIKGYFEKLGRFSSDDAKTGTVLAYTGSTAGAAYFPKEVTLSQTEVYPIEVMTLPYPYFEGGQPYVIQQGAGMCITKSDTAYEYAAALFLKWFTDPKQNVEFSVSTGYFPVKEEALDEELLLSVLNKTEGTNKAIQASIKTTLKMFDTHTLYANKPFKGSYEMRILLESHLITRVQRDLEILEKRIAQGEERSVVVEEFISQERFNEWYTQFTEEAELILAN